MARILAEFIPIFIYLVLLSLPLVFFFILLAKGKKYYKKGIAYFVVASIPLFVKISHDYTEYKESTYRHPGKYILTTYPNCDSCVLLLNEDKTYVILKDTLQIEHGNWSYKNGDQAIVKLKTDGQLGIGNYSYDTYFSNKKREPNKLLNR
jgi:hypothetical protein